MGAKVHIQKGDSPNHRLRSLIKISAVQKKFNQVRTTRRWAWKQPSISITSRYAQRELNPKKA